MAGGESAQGGLAASAPRCSCATRSCRTTSHPLHQTGCDGGAWLVWSVSLPPSASPPLLCWQPILCWQPVAPGSYAASLGRSSRNNWALLTGRPTALQAPSACSCSLLACRLGPWLERLAAWNALSLGPRARLMHRCAKMLKVGLGRAQADLLDNTPILNSCVVCCLKGSLLASPFLPLSIKLFAACGRGTGSCRVAVQC